MRTILCLSASLFALQSVARAENPYAFDTTPGRLPKNVVPSLYHIALTADLQKLTMTGHEDIDIEVTQSTDKIVLNQIGLSVSRAQIDNGDSAKITADDQAKFLTLTLPHALTPGQHHLSLDYSGTISDKPRGIYYTDYKDLAGASKRMLVTQFEVADARRMFPCWDEPAFKARFQLSVTMPKDLVLVSNTPIEKTLDAANGWTTRQFATTPRMSTYLLALVAGDMGAVRDSAAGVDLAAYAPRGEEDQARKALQAAKDVLPYYNEYFGVKYPLPKMDLIAIPGNYEAGAMENWGAITFIDDAMLFDPKTSSPRTEETIYWVTAHEMAHQWSGDLVTMGWWDNIWLNEGFATWMQNKATEHFNPSWQMWARMHLDRELAMEQDQLPSIHPIEVPVKDESDAASVFDGISYQKASQVIRMIEDWITPDIFEAGIHTYMNAHRYNNTTSADLWQALGDASHQDVAKVAASFTSQKGVPLVSVTGRACRAGHAELTLTQQPFNSWNSAVKNWVIPVTIGAPGITPQHVLLADQSQTVEFGKCASAIKLNWGENGYYRVQYDPQSLKLLQKNFAKLPGVDRAELLGDQYALFGDQRASLADDLAFYPALKTEHDFVVLREMLSQLRDIHDSLLGSPEIAKFDAYAADLVRPQLARLGWDPRNGESFLDSELRPIVISALGRLGDADVIAEAKKRFVPFVQNQDSLAPSLREPVVLIVGLHADQATYDQLKTLVAKAPGTEEKLRYAQSLAAAQDPKFLSQTIDFALSGALPNARIAVPIYVASYLSGHADDLYKMIKPREAQFAAKSVEEGMHGSILTAAAAGSKNPAVAADLLTQKSSQANLGAQKMAEETADRIKHNADVQSRTVAAIAGLLKS